MRTIELYKTDKVAIIDDEFYDLAMAHNTTWYYCDGYAYCRSKLYTGATVILHQVVMGRNTWRNGIEIDHIDRNGLNNLKSNLRFATRGQNTINRPKRKGCSSKYKNVFFDKNINKWRVRYQYKGNTIHGGCFINEDDAGRKANEFMKKHYGEFAVLNIIEADQIKTP